MLYGLDISHHQGAGFDLQRAQREGFGFAFLKATDGTSFVDPRFTANLANARTAGLIVAAYHYQRGDSTAAAQAARIMRTVPREVPVIVDVEADSGSVALTRDLITRLASAGYRCPLIYLPRWYWQQIGSPDLHGLPPLWSSRYPDTRGGYASEIYQRVPAHYWDGYGGLGVEVLQFTSSATVAGRTPVDANAFRGTRDQLAALLGPITPEEPDLTPEQDNLLRHTHNYVLDLHRLFFQSGFVANRINPDNPTKGADLLPDMALWINQTLGHVAALRATNTTDPATVAALVGPVIRDAVADALGDDNEHQAAAIVDALAARLGTHTTGAPHVR